MRISHDTAFDDILMVFDNYVKNHNENNEFWKEIQVECKGNHYWEDGNSPCHKEFSSLWTTRKVLLRLLDKYYEDMEEVRRSGGQPRRLDF